MASPLELSFDCKSQIYNILQKSLGDQQTSDQQTLKLENYLACLEEERLKINVFKRELPLCMQLLTNAMEESRQHLRLQRSDQLSAKPILENFIPLKHTISTNTKIDQENVITADKANWMTSAQLWNQDDDEITKAPQSPPLTTMLPSRQEIEIKLGLNGKQRIINGGGAFLPFSPSKDHHRVPPSSCSEGFPELALASSHNKEEMMIMEDNEKNLSGTSQRKENSTGNNSGNSCGGEKEHASGNGNNTAAQNHRKARRCWSPDLHRRFVNALHMLGGSQVATPKQIRELMKVDGLTNDEVKSHLQKYRLHTRRPSPSPQGAVTGAPQVVVLGGIWVPSEYVAAAAHGGSTATAAALYGAHGHHHVTPSFSSPAPLLPQEIYHAIGPSPQYNPNYQMHHHGGVQDHQQVHLYNAKPPLTHSNKDSPKFDIQGGAGDPSESIEDEKSESSGS